MANTFEEQAKERFRKSLAFMQKAHTLLQDDLVYRSALADAVSAIKNMLQGYLLLRISTTPSSAVTQRWQEVAISNRMPDLIAACIEAGLNLHGIERDIKRLNNERNFRTHDDPHRLVDPEHAAQAYDLALTVQRRIRAAVQGRSGAETVGTSPTTVRGGPSSRLAPVRAAVSGTLSTIARAASATPAEPAEATATSPVVSPPSQPPAASAPASEATPATAEREPGSQPVSESAPPDEPDDAPAPDETYISLPAVSRRRRRGSALLRILAAALLLIVGVVTGAGLMIPVARGQAPEWLGFASRLLPTPTLPPTVAPTPSATPIPTNSPYVLGSVVATIQGCSTDGVVLKLSNTGTAALPFAVGSADASAPRITGKASATAQAGIVATIPAGASTMLTISGVTSGQHLVLITPAGTLELLAPAC